jgi:single-strand DNA-binding protein
MNRVILVGNLTKDPELKFIPSGTAVCNLRMATNRKWKDASGEAKEEVCFVGVVVWGKQAEACGEYLKKGSQVLIEGRLQSRSWETDAHEKRSILEVVAERVQFLSIGKREGGQDAAPAPSAIDDLPF